MCFSCFHLARNNTQLEVEEYWEQGKRGQKSMEFSISSNMLEAGIYGSYRKAFNASACDLKIFCFLVVCFLLADTLNMFESGGR